MIKNFTKGIIALVIGLTLVTPPVPVSAEACNDTPVNCAKKGLEPIDNPGGSSPTLQDNIKIIVNVMMFLLGAIAVIMIIIGGIRYTTSNGDPQQTKSAKDTVLYATIGVVVALIAYAIVNFVLGAFSGNTGG